MQIRNRLSLSFTFTSSLLTLVIMAFVYILFSNLTNDEFYRALHERTQITAQLYLEADEISDSALEKIKKKYFVSLPDEVIRMYDNNDDPAFIKGDTQNWDKKIIDEVRQKKYLQYQNKTQQIVGIYYEDNQGDFVILASAVNVHGRELKHNLLDIMALLFGLQILIQFIASRWLAQSALRPIQKVNEQMQRISATDLHLRVATSNDKDEIGILAANFNGLLERLEKAFDLQKTFVANTSHELRTPITNIIGEIEVAINKERSDADYKKILQLVLVEANLLNDIVRNFLLLTSAEGVNEAQLTEPVRLDELLWEIKDTFPASSRSLLHIELKALPEEESRLYIRTNKALLSHAISNIIQNGIKFSDNQTVTCSLHIGKEMIGISIADKGMGMPADILQNIFEPFFRDSANSGHYPGHGIGLYIAKKIIELLGGTLEVSSQQGFGSTFNITFTQNNAF